MELLSYINSSGNGYGDSYGSGYGDGNGSGNSYGDSYGSGYGDGNGSGNGYGDSYGSGYGDGNGSGNGYGDSYGDGSGYEDGHGIAEFDGIVGYNMDNIQTFLVSIKHNIGKGFVLKNNYIKKDCYVYLTEDGFIAHGETLHEAREAAVEKSMQAKPIEQRLQEFVAAHPSVYTEYDDLFSWHHILTGSCEFGRKQWCEEHGLKPTDSITVRRFINETKDCYGGNIIQHLAELYGIKEGGEE